MTDFRSEDFIRNQLLQIMGFYPDCIADRVSGGFYQSFNDDGSIRDPGVRHLVNGSRLVVQFCISYQITGEKRYLELARHGLRFIEDHHWNKETQSYAWQLNYRQPVDQTNRCYGYAFVILAHAWAITIGIDDFKGRLFSLYDLVQERFWLADPGLYIDEISHDWKTISPYRGQNANMHFCEAMLAAYRATSDNRFLAKAHKLAFNVCQQLTKASNGQIWEHYDKNWSIDWHYNIENPKDHYRPWGFQTGHQTEWAKLLVHLYREYGESWMLHRAKELINIAFEKGWDNTNGGLVYGYAADESVCDSDKYYWVQAESIAAAALVAIEAKDEVFWDYYHALWHYSLEHFVDAENGSWFRQLSNTNSKLPEAPARTSDYHTLGSFWDVYQTLALEEMSYRPHPVQYEPVHIQNRRITEKAERIIQTQRL